jgi:translocation and assembly module TamA
LLRELCAASAVAASLLTPTLARAQSARAQIEGPLPADLREEIQAAIGETDRPIENRFEARRRAREAAEDAMAVLRAEGYYAYQVDAEVGDREPPQPIVRITPGPRFTLATPEVEWVGEAPSPAAQQAAQEAMELQPGEPGRAADVLAAEGRIVATVGRSGYADVAAAPRDVIVNHADSTVRPTFRIVAGDLVRLDGLRLASDGRTRLPWLRRLAPWRAGEAYDPEDVAELERRLLDTGVYESVTVGLAPREQATPEGLRPVVVTLADRPPRTIELGASFSSEDGAGLDARWTRYNVLGRADTLQVLGRLSNIDSRLGAELTLPHWRRPQLTLRTGVTAFRASTDAYDETGVNLSADLTRRFGKTSYLTLGGSLEYSQIEEIREETLTPLGQELVTVAGLAALALDRSDDPLDPRSGWRLEARAEPTLIAGDETLPFLRLQTEGSAYLPFGEAARTVVAGRLRVGAIVGGSIPEVPAPRRFYAGGGGSIRGYAYQAVGPRRADTTPLGGLSLIEGSVELRQKVTGRWGVVAFVDAGSVSTEAYPTGEDFAVGAGLGVRYDLGFGPIRADVAVPLNRRSGDAPFHIYLSIGQSF